MAPKKKGDKDKGAVASEVSSLYVKREPLAPPEPLNVEEIEDAWKLNRDAFLCPFPEFEEEKVQTTEWFPNEVETPYINESFSAKLLPRNFTVHVSAWKRAPSVSDNTAAEESAPDAKPPTPPPEPVVEADPKAKGKPKAAPKAAGKDAAPVKPGTMEQFKDLQYTGEAAVVSPAEMRTRLFELTNDEGMPPLCQSISAQISIVGEHGRFMPKGSFLWELIYPQDDEGVPLFNPHGKYIVKLYVQGKWREVLVDDIVPVGSATGSSSLHAPVLPASVAANELWPMILSKALLRAFNHDLKSPIIPVVQALTGMSACQLPLTWQNLRSCHDSRPLCCLQMTSKVDIEARQREALMMASAEVEKKPKAGKGAAAGVPALPSLNFGLAAEKCGPQAPKLSSNPVDALMQFQVSELEEEPMQVRMKAATWRPIGGTPRKVLLDLPESEGDAEEEEMPRMDQEDRQDDEDDHEDDEDEARSGQRSPSGENTVPSARSKEEGGSKDEEAQPAAVEAAESMEEMKPPAPVWPDSMPTSLMTKTVIKDYHEQIQQGGYWVGYETVEEQIDSFLVYMPTNSRSLTASLDSTWKERTDPYVPNKLQLLRLVLIPEELDLEIEPTPRGDGEEMDVEPRERGPPWHKTAFLYEPLRLDPLAAPSAAGVGPGGVNANCMLQRVDRWNPRPQPFAGPEYFSLSVTDSGGSSSSKSVLLPSGEHWYLVLDDAVKAGSVLSTQVDGGFISRSKSLAEFVDPLEFLPERGIAMTTLGTTEYPAQNGFSVWAKAEVNINTPDVRDTIELLSYVSDPALLPHLRLSLLRLDQEPSDEPSQRCALWSVTALSRVPLQPLMSLPLNKATDSDSSVKYILMLEANVPTLTKGGNFNLHLMLPPTPGAEPPKPVEPADGEAEPAGPLQLVDLKVDHVVRWSGDVVPNEKGIVLRERIVVPHGAGDQTATIRVTASGLPKVVLNAQLMGQLPPTQQMRPKVEGATPEPFLPGAPIDPKEYNGRQNWLMSKRVVAEETGAERVTFAHVLLCEGATYLLDVFVDPYKGPASLEGGTWQLEMFGSGEVELGSDTMEQDLEALVRKSWEETAADAPPVPRKERAAKTRRKWLIKQGKLEPTAEDLAEEEASKNATPEPKAEPKAKGKPDKGKKGQEVVEEPEVNKEEQEAEWLKEALARADASQHSNTTVAEFVHVHTGVEPTLVEQNPYTIAPVLDDGMFDDENEQSVAIEALGMRGTAQVRQGELEFTTAKWEQIQDEVMQAKERNAQAIINLTQWAEENAFVDPKFSELREGMRNGLLLRYKAKQELAEIVGNAEMLDPTVLQTALEEAEKQEVSTWDEELVTSGGQKKSFIEDYEALKDRLSKVEAEPLADEEAREALNKLSVSVGELQKQLKKKKIPVPPEMLEKELLQQAADAIAAAIAAASAEEGAAEPA